MEIDKLIQDENWRDLIFNFNPPEIAQHLQFLAGLKLSYDLLYNKKWDENIQEFAVKLLESIRDLYPKEWDCSWQYDAFLGLAYDVVLNYNQRYEAYKRALEKTEKPPPQLLIAMAKCCDCPGKPPISYEEAISYLKSALKDYLYVDGVGLMRKIYWFKDDLDNEQYWEKVFKKIQNTNVESPSLELKF